MSSLINYNYKLYRTIFKIYFLYDFDKKKIEKIDTFYKHIKVNKS